MAKIMAPWAIDAEELQRALNSDIKKGLSTAEAEKGLKESGLNRIAYTKSLTFWDILWEELKEPLILLLLVIGVIYSIWGKIGDTITIILVILTVTMVEVYTEFRAKKTMESLKKLSLPTSWVIREGRPVEIETSSIVPGDLLLLKSGVKVGADARVIEAQGLEVDESQLTGESASVNKTRDPVLETCGLNDRKNMVYMGSIVLKGKGLAMVVNTGRETELGKIVNLAQETRESKTPLQKSMKELSSSLIWIAVAFSLLIPLLGALRGFPLKEMILMALSLSFATVPEELPIIVTMLLGLSSIHLSRKNVLIKRTKAAETLGSVTVIATDKTGTLTQNRMSIAQWEAGDERQLFTIGALMADVVYDSEGGFLGDPMDKAILEKAKEFQIERNKLLNQYSLVEDLGFDEGRKVFQAVYQYKGKKINFIKGAPESVFSVSAPNPQMEERLKKWMLLGYRTIAIAQKEEDEENYSIVGWICFLDSVREGVEKSIEECKNAGIRVIMITGDHASTARRVAMKVGIEVKGVLTGEDLEKMTKEEFQKAIKECNLFARISPEQKLRIVTALRENGEIIAVTGDGINDAPALRAADIGISLGISGTDVAKETADMILTDDSFTSIIDAIREGRKLYENLRKCVKYYLSCKVGLIITFLIPLLFHLPFPFSPIQVLILELFLDVAASTSFVVEPPEWDLLKKGPRNPQESFMNKKMVKDIFSGSLTLALTVLLVYFLSWFKSNNTGTAQTFAFVAWLFGHVSLAINMRTNRIPLTKAGFFSNRAFNLWAAGVVIFVILALNVPVLGEYLKLSSIGILPLIYTFLTVLVTTSWMEIQKHFRR